MHCSFIHSFIHSIQWIFFGCLLWARHCSGFENIAMQNIAIENTWNLYYKGVLLLYCIVIFIFYFLSFSLDFKLLAGRSNCPNAWNSGSLKFMGNWMNEWAKDPCIDGEVVKAVQRWERLLTDTVPLSFGSGNGGSEEGGTAALWKDRMKLKGRISSCLIYGTFFVTFKSSLVAGVRSTLKGIQYFTWKWHLVCVE